MFLENHIFSLLIKNFIFQKKKYKLKRRPKHLNKSNKIDKSLKINTFAFDMHTCNLNILYLQRNLKPSCPCTSGNKYRQQIYSGHYR